MKGLWAPAARVKRWVGLVNQKKGREDSKTLTFTSPVMWFTSRIQSTCIHWNTVCGHTHMKRSTLCDNPLQYPSSVQWTNVEMSPELSITWTKMTRLRWYRANIIPVASIQHPLNCKTLSRKPKLFALHHFFPPLLTLKRLMTCAVCTSLA